MEPLLCIWNLESMASSKQDIFQNKLDGKVRNLSLNFYHCAGRVKQVATRSQVHVRWKKPEVNSYKLNTDASTLGNLVMVGGGGIIRDHNGSECSIFLDVDTAFCTPYNSGSCSTIMLKF